MIDPNPENRPSAAGLLQHPVLAASDLYKSKQQLRKELNEQKFQVEMLTR